VHEPVIISQVAAQSPYSIWLILIDRVQPSLIAGVKCTALHCPTLPFFTANSRAADSYSIGDKIGDQIEGRDYRRRYQGVVMIPCVTVCRSAGVSYNGKERVLILASFLPTLYQSWND
jgi:hypothetical protein